MNADNSWLGATPGEAVPTVGVADLKSVWKIYKDIESKHPGGHGAVGITLVKHSCSAGADVRAVTYRCGMLQILDRVHGDLLTTWKESGDLNDAVFRVAARVPMKWIGSGEHSGFPFDVDLFMQELRLESC